jgi:signal transduction histidine kinase
MTPQFRLRSLRPKILLWSFVPTAISLVAVGLVSFYAFQSTTRFLLIERNRELTRLTSGQLAGEFEEYAEVLSKLISTTAYSSRSAASLEPVLKQASSSLSVYDGGVVLTDERGVVIASEPERPEIHGQDWSDRLYFRDLVRSGETVFSDVVGDGPGGAQAIVIAVPVIGANDEFLGMAAGIFRLGATYTSPFYGNIVKLRIGAGDYAHLETYIVDREGLVIYHSDSEQIGADFSGQEAVTSLLTGNFVDEFSGQEPLQAGFRGNAGAVRVRDGDGGDVIAYFSAIPGTGWGLVSESSWGGLLSVYRRYLITQSFLFVLGVILPALVVGTGIRRITEPIYQLMSAAREVARGNFGRELSVHTGDELEELGAQFNHMSRQISQSYETLEQRVEERTRDLAALNAISALVNRSLDLNTVLNNALDKILEIMNMDSGVAFRLEGDRENQWISPEEAAERSPDHLYLHPLVYRGISGQFIRFAGRQSLAESGVGAAINAETPLVWEAQAAAIEPVTKAALMKEGIEQVVSIPLKVKGRLVGAIQMGTRQVRSFSPEELELLEAIGQQVGVAVENARLHEAAQHTVALEERARLARELHDSVTQSLYSVTLLAEAAARLLSAGDSQTAAGHLRELRDTAQESLAEMRLLIYELRPVALEKSGLADALRFRLEAVEARSGIKTELCVEGVEKLPYEAKVELYQIAQETLNNVLKHSHAQKVQLTLRFLDGLTCMEVSDDGAGFEPEQAARSGGLGLAGIAERAEKIGGKFQIHSEPGKGTRISVEVGTQRSPESLASLDLASGDAASKDAPIQ